MFKTYGDMYEDLRKKAEVVEQNRSEVLGELQGRFDRWKTVMGKLLEDLSSRYGNLLDEVGGKGRIDLKSSKNIEKAGLELYAGFKGNEPVSLDSLAPSGGERTVALIAFLLSLQQLDRKSTRLNSSHLVISYAVFCLKKKKKHDTTPQQNRTTLKNKLKLLRQLQRTLSLTHSRYIHSLYPH